MLHDERCYSAAQHVAQQAYAIGFVQHNRSKGEKQQKTWCCLQDLTMPGSHVDVNLHPTKQEVGFLHQDELLEAIREAVEELLLSSNDQ